MNTYPIQVYSSENGYRILIDVRINNKNKKMLLDTGGGMHVILKESLPRSSKLPLLTIGGFLRRLRGREATVDLQAGSCIKRCKCIYLDKKAVNEMLNIDSMDDIDGVIGFGVLSDHFNGINVSEKYIYQKKNTEDYAHVKLHQLSLKFKKPVFELEKTLYIIDTGSYHSGVIFPESSMQDRVVLSIPESPLYFLISDDGSDILLGKTKQVTPKIVLLGMDFVDNIGSFFITDNAIYFEKIRIKKSKTEVECDKFCVRPHNIIYVTRESNPTDIYKYVSEKGGSILVIAGKNKITIERKI